MKTARKSAAAAVVPANDVRLRPLPEALTKARRKVEADALRFRTCCADPRASK